MKILKPFQIITGIVIILKDNDKRGKAHKLFESTPFILYLKELGVVLEIR